MPLPPLPPIPSPIAPARPIANTIPVSMNGITGNLDQFGNILDAAGKQIGVVPNSVADVGTPSVTQTQNELGIPNSTSMQTSGGVTTNPNPPAFTPGGIFGQLETWILAHLEDGVVIVVGIILIAAGVFSFKQAQTIIETGGKIVKKASEVASA